MAELTPSQALARDLIKCPSVTPHEGGALDLLEDRLTAAEFRCYRLPFGEGEERIDNLFAIWGDAGPHFCFAGHTDVVPAGDDADWTHPPFAGAIKNGMLFGRGAVDMKGAIAAFVTASLDHIAANPPKGQISFLITGDEEGDAIHGTRPVLDWLNEQNMMPDVFLVGDPTNSESIGDVVKNGRRGSLGCTLTVRGQQGHVAYPHLADNPVHRAVPALTALSSEVWDNGNAFFPATSFQISNIQAGTGATNVIPGELEVEFNFRFSTELTEQQIIQRTEQILDQYKLDYSADWNLSGHPFLTAEGELVSATVTSIAEVTGLDTELSTAGGTSDGRFIAPFGVQVVELGPVNASIHKIDENTSIEGLNQLTLIYQAVLTQLLQ